MATLSPWQLSQTTVYASTALAQNRLENTPQSGFARTIPKPKIKICPQTPPPKKNQMKGIKNAATF
jgi:hypothetical protein